ncbi:MAG: hypothetical protein CSA70_03545 [Rhodobacterales bacterium]|nr:MAG: hypothetical protein CSA70_03545 [Rhodobacterales bacterium]
MKPAEERITDALNQAEAGQFDGAQHKMWVIDQMVRALCGSPAAYAEWIAQYKQGVDGPETYEWDAGTAP